MARAGAEREQGGRVDVVVLTVIPAELEAARRALDIDDHGREKDSDGTVYFRGAVHSALAGRDYGVVLTCIGGAGNPGAAAATVSALAKYHPRAVLLIGIAAGIRDKIRIGDVVLSDRVVAYEPAALVRPAGGTSLQPRPEIDRISHAMLQDVVTYRAEPARLRYAFARASGVVPSPPPGREDEFRAHVASTIGARLGTVASGEKLLRDPVKLVEVRQLHGKTEVGEMEAAGVVDGCRRGNVPWLVIRGISDFGDDLKDDRFHAFASCAAAAVLVDFLAHGLDLGGGDAPDAVSLERTIRSTTVRNPFVFGRAIDRDEDFAGRINERRWLQDAIDLRQPVQLLGERLMGKTSLLRWAQRTVWPGRPVIWFDPSRGVTPASMVHAIATALGKSDAALHLDRPDATARQASKLLDALVPFVLLVDDADTLSSRGDGFEDGFFEALRTLVQDGKLTWVSASRRNLYDMFKAQGLTSRFLNDAKKLWVGGLTQEAAIGLEQGCRDEGVAARIVDAAGRFAYGLQWLGDFVCRRPGQIDQACDAFAEDMASTFHAWWSGLDAHEQQLVKRCAAGAVIVDELDDRSRRRLRGLHDRGLVTERDRRMFLEGETWRSFVADAA